MRLLIVSHPCVTLINQQFYAEVEQQTGWQLQLVVPANWKNEYSKRLIPDRWPEYRGQLISIPVSLSGNIPLHLYRSTFVNLLHRFQPDIIYVHHEPYALATTQLYLANLMSVKKPIGFFTWQNIYKNYPFPFQQMQNFVFKNSYFAFSGSYSAQDVLKQKGYKQPCFILPSGIDPEIYFPHPEATKLKRELQEVNSEILIGYVGRIVEEKGLKTLLYALKIIENLHWRLIMIGSGSYESHFDDLTQQLQLTKRINRLGYIPHSKTPTYLSAFDVLVLPSETQGNWKEQFGRVIIEAIACGTPVIGSDSGEIPNLIRATKGGLIFPERQPEALAEKLKQLILDDSRRSLLIEQGQKIVLDNYTSASLAKNFAQVLEKITFN